MLQTRLNNIFQNNAETGHSDPVIDITGEKDRGGSTSNVFGCNKCVYKTSQEKNLTKHKKSEHSESILTCELCEFVGKSMVDYNNHVKEKHAELNNAPKQQNSQTKTANTNTNTTKKPKKNRVEFLVIFVVLNQNLLKISSNILKLSISLKPQR